MLKTKDDLNRHLKEDRNKRFYRGILENTLRTTLMAV